MKQKKATNDTVNIKDVRGNVGITKDMYLIAYLVLPPTNIDLLSKKELHTQKETLAAEFKGEQQAHWIISIPRTVNLDKYIKNYSRHYDNEPNALKRMLLSVMIKEANSYVRNGNNFQQQRHIALFEKIDGSMEKTFNKLKTRIDTYQKRYASIGIELKLIDKPEIIKLFNLFANGESALLYDYSQTEQMFFSMMD